jgi:hypothetical protein
MRERYGKGERGEGGGGGKSGGGKENGEYTGEKKDCAL